MYASGFGDSPKYDAWQAKLVSLKQQIRATDDPRQKLDLLTSLMNAIGQLAIEAPTDELRARWQEYFRSLQPTAAYYRQTYKENPPADWLIALDKFADRVIGVADNVVSGLQSAYKGVTSAVGILPLLLVGLVTVVGVGLAKGSLSARVSR